MPKSGFTSEQIDTVKSLLKLANANIETLRSSDFEEMTTEIESVSANLSEQVFEYWHQNDSLSVSAVINPVAITDEHGTQRIEKRLSLRIRDDSRKSYSCSFEDRSTGFKWFFSFFAAFGCYSDQKRTAIVLLDEPALSLHGKAQADFLSFINDRLAPYVQVIYTTHSPFMVETNKSHRIRLVEDRGGEVGVSISDQSLAVEASSDTVFPLQAALGYDIAQSMFIGNKNLLIEGVSDYIYLTVMDSILEAKNKTHLNRGIRLMPAGSASNIPTFLALLGKALPVSVLMDSTPNEMQKIDECLKQRIINKNRLVLVGDIIGKKNADIEDLFHVEDYLTLYNGAFETSVHESDLSRDERIVKRIEKATHVTRFDHFAPAEYLMKESASISQSLKKETLNNFELLFKKINASMKTYY